MTNKPMKGCSVSLLIRKMQIKATMRYHFTLIRTAIRVGVWVQEGASAGKGREQLELLCLAGRNVKCYSGSGQDYGE